MTLSNPINNERPRHSRITKTGLMERLQEAVSDRDRSSILDLVVRVSVIMGKEKAPYGSIHPSYGDILVRKRVYLVVICPQGVHLEMPGADKVQPCPLYRE